MRYCDRLNCRSESPILPSETYNVLTFPYFALVYIDWLTELMVMNESRQQFKYDKISYIHSEP